MTRNRQPGHGDQNLEALHEEVIPELLTDPDPLRGAPDFSILLKTEQEMAEKMHADLLGKVRAVIEAEDARASQAGAGSIDPAPAFVSLE